MDRNGSDEVDEREIAARVNLVVGAGVDVTQDGFAARWDLDGNGRVDDDELPESARIPLQRKGRNKD